MLCGCNGNPTLKMPYEKLMFFTVVLFTSLLNRIGLLVIQIYKLQWSKYFFSQMAERNPEALGFGEIKSVVY